VPFVSKSHIVGRSPLGRALSRTRDNLVAKIHSKYDFRDHLPQKPASNSVIPTETLQMRSKHVCAFKRILLYAKLNPYFEVFCAELVVAQSVHIISRVQSYERKMTNRIPESKSKRPIVCKRMLLLERCNSSHTSSRTEMRAILYSSPSCFIVERLGGQTKS